MLLREHLALESCGTIKMEKLLNGKRVDTLGAFASGAVLLLRARIPRRLGVATVVLRIAADGEEPRDMPFSFCNSEQGEDLYELTLDTAALCQGEGRGLFFYEYLFLRGFDTCFSDSINNVDFVLSPVSANRFRLLIHDADFAPPAWFMGGTMYHVFLDRFFRGEGEVLLREGAELNPDWKNGIPQYVKTPGEPLSNHIFFGGNLWGVTQKLDYLQSLGVTVLYLSPIFSAYSNHRYDTASYEEIDGLLGGRAALDQLLGEAHKRGMRVILDGVFNHTGDDSVYFNRRGRFPQQGAYQSKESPWADWYSFREFPDEYEAWWGIEIMPRLQHRNESCRRYFTGEKGIAAKWIEAGADGWRLDVADELPDEFLDELRATVKGSSNGQGIIIGEVWENAADKIAYGKRRQYFLGGQLDSVMNYPLRNAVLGFLLEKDGESFYNILTELYGSYPKAVSHSLMNLLGTHDTERFLTTLGADPRAEEQDNDLLATLRLSPERRCEALRLMRMAATLQFTVFGVPSIYYGDEVGLEGYHDPFCRMPFPWGSEDEELLTHYRRLGALRREHPALRDGEFSFLFHSEHAFAYLRSTEGDQILTAANMGAERISLELPEGVWTDVKEGETYQETFWVEPETARILILKQK